MFFNWTDKNKLDLPVAMCPLFILNGKKVLNPSTLLPGVPFCSPLDHVAVWKPNDTMMQRHSHHLAQTLFIKSFKRGQTNPFLKLQILNFF